ncbi:MAG: hypothetical protein D4R64_00625 [Porphyromonadaceae bacterium]|nr:MAG: hypothetical protein D4R64_00625 [Porphyromonadaceae bacterium]
MTTSKISACLLSFGIFILLTNCASVKFFNDEGLKNETGLRVYSPKPYLLVEYQTTKTQSVKTSIIYLPDLSDPQYIKLKPGIGSSALKLELNNGILTSYGLTTDTKMPETLGKITDLLTKSTSSIADITRNKTEGELDQLVYELFEIVMTDGLTKLVRVK